MPPRCLFPGLSLQGNKLLWDYDESRDPELQQVFNLVTSAGINLFDTADSYGGCWLGLLLRELPGSPAASHAPRCHPTCCALLGAWSLCMAAWGGLCPPCARAQHPPALPLQAPASSTGGRSSCWAALWTSIPAQLLCGTTCASPLSWQPTRGASHRSRQAQGLVLVVGCCSVAL